MGPFMDPFMGPSMGPMGSMGSTGLMGPMGSMGGMGPMGSMGPMGPMGPIGGMSPMGSMGPMGGMGMPMPGAMAPWNPQAMNCNGIPDAEGFGYGRYPGPSPYSMQQGMVSPFSMNPGIGCYPEWVPPMGVMGAPMPYGGQGFGSAWGPACGPGWGPTAFDTMWGPQFGGPPMYF